MTHINENTIRNTPEVHDREWEPELSPRHEWVKFFSLVGPLLIGITAFLYAGREIVSIVSGWLS
ncbi:hypothetical protein [Thalassospira tepidiphila]|uniref:Uncharacterized protein n=2 Tax=Thalassospira tepidiphila TaxID=393657 RepID=A0A853KWN3_9PROT|nr:hypothetical protein [Thalassospira tepidiphila]NJB74589.1 hypothetical protein [Thalassospira tepidiphila]OAZ08078.1 hypothetical protein TH4_18685 [Thalassospira tepidiphila MCCC 1A03514]